MSYLRNKQEQRKKIGVISAAVFFLAIILLFRVSVMNGLRVAAHAVFSPFLSLKNNIAGGLASYGANLESKKALIAENEALKNTAETERVNALDRGVLLDENTKLKEILSRTKEEKNLILGVILAKPNQSPYDTLIVDAGENLGVKVGSRVFAFGNVLIGEVSEVYGASSNIKLYSTSGETLRVIVDGTGIYTEAIGRGGGNFEITLPRDVVITSGITTLSIPGITPQIVATVEQVISDPRDPFQKILAISPVNVQELKFVEVERF